MTRKQLLKVTLVALIFNLTIGFMMRKPDEPLEATIIVALAGVLTTLIILGLAKWLAEP